MEAEYQAKRPPVSRRAGHLDTGSVAGPNRDTDAMRDGSDDAISDWPMRNALPNCASGATWMPLHHGGGDGMGFSRHYGSPARPRMMGHVPR